MSVRCRVAFIAILALIVIATHSGYGLARSGGHGRRGVFWCPMHPDIRGEAGGQGRARADNRALTAAEIQTDMNTPIP